MAIRILFVDDEREIVSSFVRSFTHKGYETAGAHNVAEATAVLQAAAQPGGKRIDVVVTDLRMPDGDGLDVLKAVRKLIPGCPVLVLTAFGSVATSVQAMRLGALTMLEKPVGVSDLEKEIKAAIADGQEVQGGLSAAGAAGLIGTSGAIRQLFDTLVRVAPSSSSVLIQGESGTGKELVAQALHRFSRRANGPLVAVNCAAIPEPLLESELFGHMKGAFTGAVTTRPGRFKLAHGGTIFLDEIGEMPLSLQGKMLRVLQERVIEPVGANKPEPVDFRVVAATNRDLEAMVAEGKFRGDLFYRLNVVPLALPPLRERPGDVAVLARHFLGRLSKESGAPLRFSVAAMEALERYPWPGNVRELENMVERLAVLKGEGEIGLDDLPPQLRAVKAGPSPARAPMPQREPPPPAPVQPAASAQAPSAPSAIAAAGDASSGNGGAAPSPRPAAAAGPVLPPEGVDLYAVLADLEDRLISEALERSGGNRKQAAKILGLNRTTLVEKLKKKAATSGLAAGKADAPAEPAPPEGTDGGEPV